MKRSLKKRGAPLGQHLLTSPAIAEKIAEVSGAREGATMLEVGPGKGILTRALLARGARVVAIEKDPSMIHALNEICAKEIKHKQLTILEGDAREVLPNLSLKKYSVASNIPYYLTGELIRLFLTAKNQPERVALLVQKEVAERIARSKKESILSLSVKAYGTPRYIKTVKAGSFNPPPKVDSAILLIEHISRKNFADVLEKYFFAVVHAGFGQKRKMLLGNLTRAFPTANSKDIFHALNLSPTIRAEEVDLARWFLLATHLFRYSIREKE